MLKRIVVPLDGSALAEAILPQVMEFARTLGAELLVLRVAFAHVFPGVDATKEEVETVRQAEEYVGGVAAQLADAGLAVRTSVRYGKPAVEIVSHVVDNHADFVAMSTHGRSGLSRLVMGSVAEAVVRNAGVPVLLVHPQHENPEAR